MLVKSSLLSGNFLHPPPPTSCAIRGAKTRIIGSFKSNQCAPRPVFFARVSACHKQTTFPLENFRAAKLVVLLSNCKRESGSESG
jgi:hypothetical protein